MNGSGARRTRPGGRLAAAIDLAFVAVLAIAAAVLVLTFGPQATATTVFGFLLVTFAPGYAVVAAIFPEDGGRDWSEQTDGSPSWRASVTSGFGSGLDEFTRERGVDGVERFVLSVGLSVALVPLFVIGLDAAGQTIRPDLVVQTVSGFTLAAVAVAAIRRVLVPADDRFRVPVWRLPAVDRSGLFETRTDLALNALFGASLLFAAVSVGYAVTTPAADDTDVSLLVENETGSLVAEGYPTAFERGEPTSMAVKIENGRQEQTRYTVVTLLQRTRTTNDTVTVTGTRELERRTVRVDGNETSVETYDVAPPIAGDQLRLAFLVYRGDAPDQPTVDNAYRRLHLWIDVSEPDE